MRSILYVGLILVLVACQQIGGQNGSVEVSITGDLEMSMVGAQVATDYNNTGDFPESITIGLTRGGGNDMTIFTLTLPPEPELRDYTVIGPARNPLARGDIRSAEVSLFHVSGSDSREYSQGVTGMLTFTEVGEMLSASFEARIFLGNLAAGTADSTRFIDVSGTFSVPNPHP